MSILKEIKKKMTVTTADRPAQLSNAKSLTLGDRIKAAMPGMKPAKIDDRRQATHMRQTIHQGKPAGRKLQGRPNFGPSEVQRPMGPRKQQMTVSGIEPTDRLAPEVRTTPARVPRLDRKIR